MIAARLAEAKVAAMLLTRLPVGPIDGAPPAPAAAVWAFPLVGALVGLIGWAGYALATAAGLPPMIAALVAVAACVWLTGGLHEDGLADLADGIGGGRDQEARLAIMRDSRIGSFGALALIVAIGLRVLAVAELGAVGPLLAAFVATGAASRFAIVGALALMPPARRDGLGHGAGLPRAGPIAAAAVLTVLCLAPLGQAAAAVAGVMALAGALTGLVAMRKLGGQTGDVLGAVQIVTEIAGWLTLLAALTAQGCG